jgi:hypothetical protein
MQNAKRNMQNAAIIRLDERVSNMCAGGVMERGGRGFQARINADLQ